MGARKKLCMRLKHSYMGKGGSRHAAETKLFLKSHNQISTVSLYLKTRSISKQIPIITSEFNNIFFWKLCLRAQPLGQTLVLQPNRSQNQSPNLFQIWLRAEVSRQQWNSVHTHHVLKPSLRHRLHRTKIIKPNQYDTQALKSTS